MNAVTEPLATRAAILETPKARVGIIIPSSNRLAEPQLRHYLPAEIGLHTTRLRMTGPWHKPLGEIHDAIKQAAGALNDSKCDVIVFDCTGGAMADGPEEETRVLELIAEETDAEAMSTGEAVVDALRAVAIKSMVLVTPYVQSTNDAEKIYLESLGFEVLNDIALGLGGGNFYIHVPPEKWLETTEKALMGAGSDADGVFLSCTNTTQIEIIPIAEQKFGRPCINSNQAVIWAALNRIRARKGQDSDSIAKPQGLGKLFDI
ncbi:MAG: hypothetical protein HN565_05515 [Rhodospirillales bacterium]|nr:hypothetical protein [Rhodospirillales bacterium]